MGQQPTGGGNKPEHPPTGPSGTSTPHTPDPETCPSCRGTYRFTRAPRGPLGQLVTETFCGDKWHPLEQPETEPVGPYAPTRAEGGPIHTVNVPMGGLSGMAAAAARIAETARTAREGQVPRLVEAGMTPTQAAAHVERLAEIQMEREQARAVIEQARAKVRADQDQYRDGYAAGVKIGAAEGEARALDGQFVETEIPSAYDVAERALDYATRLVSPVYAVNTMVDEQFGPVASQYARLTTDLADKFYGWLWQFNDPNDPFTSPQQLGERVDTAKLPRCPQPQCGVLLDASGACTDPWCPSGGAVVGDPVIERVPTPEDQQFRPMPEAGVTRCPSCGMSMKYGCSNPQCEAGPEPSELAEDPAQALPCPECRAGKHPNCSGDSWGPRPDTPEGDGPVPCPCTTGECGETTNQGETV